MNGIVVHGVRQEPRKPTEIKASRIPTHQYSRQLRILKDKT